MRILLVLTLSIGAYAQGSISRIPKVTRPPKLADFVGGAPREAELAISDFRQMDPTDGAPVSQPTTAYLSFDDKNLYVGWICKDDPKLVRARVARRKDIESDDRVTINIDTFHDHKHAYWFDVNAYAIQLDGITTDGQGDDRSWESLWYTEAQFTPDGYVVLETIPFRSLRFPPGNKQVWGIVLGRFINRNNEFSMWPFVSRTRFPQFVGQFADVELDADISPGRNLQFIPYTLGSRSRYLDETGNHKDHEIRGGLDARMVLKDAFTLDLTLNPDFSQVESDEPQVTINQRYEVFFPEKRPFFMEKASLFNTPEQLFFSRRIADPQFGARLTGTVGRWSLGVLAADDRAPGRALDDSGEEIGGRAADAVLRVEREFGRQSHIGMLATSYNFGGEHNQVGSLDTRIALTGNWTLSGQATATETRGAGGARIAGPGYHASLSNSGLHFDFRSAYTDRSPGYRALLGYIPRVDVREWTNSSSYHWRPKERWVVSFGPGIVQSVNWNRLGQVQDWGVAPHFTLEMQRGTMAQVGRTESYELFQGRGFRNHNNEVEFSTDWYKWMSARAEYSWGKGVNYYPGQGVTPFPAASRYATLGLTIRPEPRLKLDESYIYNRLGGVRDWLPPETAEMRPGAIFNNHILRSKVNYQFNRELSVRAIFDYNGVLPNARLVALERSKRLGADLLLTYLLHPGTAMHVGYTNVHENLAWDASGLRRTGGLGAVTGSQVFVKLSYLLRY